MPAIDFGSALSFLSHLVHTFPLHCRFLLVDNLYSKMSNHPSSSSSLAAKRGADGPSLSSERPTKRRGVLPAKFKQNVYHMKRNDIPEDAAGFKVCDLFHIFTSNI
jgi:hypothetical protein